MDYVFYSVDGGSWQLAASATTPSSSTSLDISLSPFQTGAPNTTHTIYLVTVDQHTGGAHCSNMTGDSYYKYMSKYAYSGYIYAYYAYATAPSGSAAEYYAAIGFEYSYYGCYTDYQPYNDIGMPHVLRLCDRPFGFCRRVLRCLGVYLYVLCLPGLLALQTSKIPGSAQQ